MLNLDKIEEKKTEILNSLAASIRENNEEGVKDAMNSFQDFMTESIMAEAKGVLGSVDNAVLSNRGVRQLTSAENKFYKDFIANAKNQVQEGSVITGINDVLPETVIESVFEDLRANHPLLDVINFVNTSAITKMVVNKQGEQQATWDALNEPITKQLTGAIEIMTMTLCKLTAYMYVTMDMLDLGPAWIDRYVRETMSEALATALEVGIVDGDGVDKPIGFTRNFKGAFEQETGYARKQALTIPDFGKETYGLLLSKLSVDGNSGRTRAVSEVILVCNPADYFSKVMPVTTMLTPNGTYINNVFPFPTRVIQSVGVPSGMAVIGLAKKYFMGLGNAKGGKLEHSDEHKFIEDLRTYKIKLYGNGKPLDMNAFLLLDISGVQEVFTKVETVTPADTAELSALSVGFNLSPEFNKETKTYTATANTASSVVMAIPKDGDADVKITNGDGAPISNGSLVKWPDNTTTTLTFEVTCGAETQTYTVAVTRGTPS